MSKVEERKYSLLSNIMYVYKGVALHKPYLIRLLPVSIICSVGHRFIWLFLSKYIIEYIGTGNMGINELLQIVLWLAFANVVCALGRNAVNFGKEPAAFYVRPMFMLERNKKIINMSYENLEHNEVLDALQKSRKSTTNTESGIEGIIRFILVFCYLFTSLIRLV